MTSTQASILPVRPDQLLEANRNSLGMGDVFDLLWPTAKSMVGASPSSGLPTDASITLASPGETGISQCRLVQSGALVHT